MKLGVKEIRCAPYGGQNPAALLEVAMGYMLFLRQRNIVTVGKIFNGIRERKVLVFSYKAEDIASALAPEAVVELVFSIHLERRCLFLVERAQPDVPVARPTQTDRPAYHLDNIHCLLYQSGNIGISHSASLSGVKKETANENQKVKTDDF
jgi:hypothetical protein